MLVELEFGVPLRKGVNFFFSFSHGQKQTVGSQNLVNLAKYSDGYSRKFDIDLSIRIRELPCHSAVMQHLSINFLEEYKYSRNCEYRGTELTLLDIDFWDAFFLVGSDHLNVGQEYIPFNFVIDYCRQFEDQKRKTVNKAVTMLVSQVRLQQLDIHSIIEGGTYNSIMPDNEYFCSIKSKILNENVE